MLRFPKWMTARAVLFAQILTVSCLLVLIACGAPAAAPKQNENLPSFQAASGVTAAPAQPTAAPAPTQEPQATRRAQAASAPTAVPAAQDAAQGFFTATAFAPSSAQDLDRKIIKTSNLIVVVESADTAIFRFTGIVSDFGGYIVSNRVYSDNNLRGATMVVAVPVERFEEALNLIRGVPKEIIQDFISSSDVTEQYVDLEARLKNLEATAIRIRELLTRADTVEDALKINLELSNIESQIEQIKGKLNALSARTSFSTITIDMREPAPTPTPSPTPTVTPSPTSIAWRPDETVSRAVQTQNSLLRGLGDTLIWVGIVLLPYLIAALLIGLLVRWFVLKTRRKVTP